VSGPEQRVLAAIDGLPDFLFCAPDEPPADDFALTIMLTRTCGPGAAGETATEQRGTRRSDERIRTGSSYRDRRFGLLPGAGVTYEFKLTGTGAEEAAADISRAIGYVGRDQLADQVRRYRGGLLQLDPGRR
jgi:hypothetical protein